MFTFDWGVFWAILAAVPVCFTARAAYLFLAAEYRRLRELGG